MQNKFWFSIFKVDKKNIQSKNQQKFPKKPSDILVASAQSYLRRLSVRFKKWLITWFLPLGYD